MNQLDIEREKGKFPSQPVANPKANGKETTYQIGNTSLGPPHYQGEIKSVTTLRSGRKVDNHVEPPKSSIKVSSPSPVQGNYTSESILDQPALVDKPGLGDQKELKPVEPKLYVPKPPFPGRLVQSERQKMFDEIKEVFKNVHINIPFLIAILTNSFIC